MADVQTDSEQSAAQQDQDEKEQDLLERLGLHPAQLKVQEHLLNAAQGNSSGLRGESPATPADVPQAPMPRMSVPSGASTAPQTTPVQSRPILRVTPAAEENVPSPSMPPFGNSDSMPPMQTPADVTPAPAPKLAAPSSTIPPPIKRPSQFSEGENNFQQKHHFWGGVLKGLDVAGSIVAPGAMSLVPGTMLNQKVRDASEINTRKAATEQAQADATYRHTVAETNALDNKPGVAPKPEFDKAGDLVGFTTDGELLGPNSPKLTQDMRDMMAAAKGKAAATGTPESQAMAYLVSTGLNSVQAYAKIQSMKAENKPDTATQNKQRFQDVIGGLTAETGNRLDPGILTDPRKTASAISNSRTLTPEEKQFALSYIAANPTPANQVFVGEQRGASYGATRQYSVLDSKNGNRPIYVSADELNRAKDQEPGRYLASGPATTALNKENLMEDIRGGIQQVRDALTNPNMPDFTTKQNVKIAIAMRERDPRSAVSSLITSGDLGTMTPEQEDYLIAHSILAEQAMAMRSVLGAGQGSQDLRAAITATFPGPTTPSKAYGLKQLDAFEKTINRLERGIPNVPLKPLRDGGSTSGSPASLAGPIQQGESTAVGPGGHTIVFRSDKWVDPVNGKEVGK